MILTELFFFFCAIDSGLLLLPGVVAVFSRSVNVMSRSGEHLSCTSTKIREILFIFIGNWPFSNEENRLFGRC